MRKSGFVTQADFEAHRNKDWRHAHHIWENIMGVTIAPHPKGAVGAHTHVKVDITDTPWAWADVLKVGSNLTDLATRQHAGLTDVTHSQHHPQFHAAEHEVGGGDLLAFASITGFSTYLDQAVKQASSPTFANLNLGAAPLIRQASGALTFQTNEGVNTDTLVSIKGKGTGKGIFHVYNADDAEYLRLTAVGGIGYIYTAGATPGALIFQTNVAKDILCWNAIPAGNPYFYIYGWHVTDPDYMRMRVEADGNALIEAENDLNLRAGGGEINLGDENLTTTGIIAATTLQGALHWDYITNEPAFYPPEYHYHVGRDVVSTHLVDLDDVEADDIFDVLATGDIDGLGNYDWWGTWQVTPGADCSCEVVVLAGDDKMLRLTDDSGVDDAYVSIATDADHPMVISAVQFKIRQSSNAKEGIFGFSGGGGNTYISIADDGNIKFYDGAALTVLQVYAANTWYTIRVYHDLVAKAVAVFVDNVYKITKTVTGMNYIDRLIIRTKISDSVYTLDINELKIFNLTV